MRRVTSHFATHNSMLAPDENGTTLDTASLSLKKHLSIFPDLYNNAQHQ